MFEQNLTITDVVSRQFYGQDRQANGARIRRQNRSAKREAFSRSQPWFLAEGEHAALRSRLRALRYDAAASDLDPNHDLALALLAKAEPSYRRPGHVVLLLSGRDAVLLGNVLRRLDGPVPSLARLDAIAGRSEQGAR